MATAATLRASIALWMRCIAIGAWLGAGGLLLVVPDAATTGAEAPSLPVVASAPPAGG